MAGRDLRGRPAAALAMLVSTVLLGTACSSGSGFEDLLATEPGSTGSTGTDPTPTPTPDPDPPATVTVAPTLGATDISPIDPVVVTSGGGTLTSVRITNADGYVVKGAMSEDQLTWTSSEPLGYGKTYGVAAVAVNAEGRESTAEGQLTTLTPSNLTLPSFTYTDDGGTYGVGQPVVVRFDEPIPDQAAAERVLSVSTTPAVEGSWHWINSREVHWRPPNYWAPGTKVTVTAKVYGTHLGEGLYGQADRSVSYTIGSSHVAIVDDRTHMMEVFIDGVKVRDIPVSMGMGGGVTVNGRDISFTTMSGPHVVTEHHRTKVMSSSSYGLPEDNPQGYTTEVEYAVRVSNTGEFVHSAPWSVADQGVRNVSHGCINIAPDQARWFYDTFRRGDIVDVRNTGRPLPYTDGLGDWVLSWDEWVNGSALH